MAEIEKATYDRTIDLRSKGAVEVRRLAEIAVAEKTAQPSHTVQLYFSRGRMGMKVPACSADALMHLIDAYQFSQTRMSSIPHEKTISLTGDTHPINRVLSEVAKDEYRQYPHKAVARNIVILPKALWEHFKAVDPSIAEGLEEAPVKPRVHKDRPPQQKSLG